jgi:glycosyltransferase involved in cell wall biosynthesis
MNSKRPLVCVVTPFCNVGDYLAECIESVLRQTYDNWEYILVNNRSTDKSAEIAEHYVKLHPERIRLVHNVDFLSQIQNYNRALSLISPKSKYCKFVQADDWLFPECLGLMVEAAERDPSIGVVGSYSLEGRDVAFGGLPYPSPVVDGKAVCRLFFLESRYLFGSPTQLLLRSDLVLKRTPFYDESYIPFEDAAVIFQLLRRCNFGFVHQVLTFSRRDNSSVMKALMDLDCSIAFQVLMQRDFGHDFLTPEEYRAQLWWRERAYFQTLADGLLELRGKEFWKFHKSMLKRMGYSFRSAHFLQLFLGEVADIVLNPKRSVTLFIHSLRRQQKQRRARRRAASGYAHDPTSVVQEAKGQDASP